MEKCDHGYIDLLCEYYKNTDSLLDSITRDTYHLLWYAARDKAYYILRNQASWCWLSTRIDDFSLLTTNEIIQKLPKWQSNAKLDIGSLSKHIWDIQETIIWLINRWISTLKNLFDKRYKFSIQPSYIQSFYDSTIYFTKEDVNEY